MVDLVAMLIKLKFHLRRNTEKSIKTEAELLAENVNALSEDTLREALAAISRTR